MQMMFFRVGSHQALSTSQISKVPSNFPQLCKKDIGGTKILMMVYFYACDEQSEQVTFLLDNIRRENQLRLKLGGNEIKAR